MAKFQSASNDKDNRLGTYLQINPTLYKPSYHSQLLLETNWLILSRFKFGSNYLLIEKGRITNIPRNERHCLCNMWLQTVCTLFY